jgi:uncharacterized protein (TIGR03437 family)
MLRHLNTLLATMVLSTACGQFALAQGLGPTILEIDIENVVEYQSDISDPSKFGTNPNITPSGGTTPFGPGVALGDIVAVNGEPAKGTVVARPWGLDLTPTANPGRAIADTTRGSIGYRTFEILKTDGTPIGTLMVLGLNGGATPPGPNFGGQNFAIVGGTGAFLGARGQQGGRQTPQTIAPRTASIAEDPANRRRNGGGRVRWLLAVIPMTRPEIVMTGGEPMIAHASDFSLVTPAKPADPGEMLYLFATGLGPTVPAVDFGQAFPSSPRAVVNSPVKVTVNGKSADVLTAAGFAGAVDTYQVQFQVPPGTATGVAMIQVTAAWSAGPAMPLSIR